MPSQSKCYPVAFRICFCVFTCWPKLQFACQVVATLDLLAWYAQCGPVGPQTRGLRDAGGVTWNLRISKAGGFESLLSACRSLSVSSHVTKGDKGHVRRCGVPDVVFFCAQPSCSNILFAIFGTFKTEQAEEVCDQMLHHFSVPRHLVLSPSEKPIDAWS